jgi:geranylgeranyl pyrophosphate synthase
MLAMREPQIAGKLKSLLVDQHVLSADEAQQVVQLVRESNGPQQALDRARELASEARHQLAALDGGDAGKALAALSDYVVSRKL